MRSFLAILVLGTPLFAQCDYTVTPSPTLVLPSNGSTGQISVFTQSNCSWTVSKPSFDWLTFDALQGTGSGTVTYTSIANPTGAARSGTLTIAGKTISVSQAATLCSYTFDSPSRNFPAGAGSGSFKVSSGCVWQPVSSRGDFLNVTEPNPVRFGNDTVNYTLSANPCAYSRAGAIVINNTSSVQPAYNVTQDGSPANLTTSPASILAGPAAADASLAVNTGTGCTWSAFASETWIQLITTSGTGSGRIVYHLPANTTAARTGTIHIGSLNVSVTQNIAGTPAASIVSVGSAANYRTDAISPGEIVYIKGSNLGPATLTTLQVSGNAVTTQLAGTQVLFDGTPAPMIYTSSTQVSAVVPYGVAGKSSTNVQVTYNGGTSATLNVPVQSAHPGIFTLDSSGLGPGAILNQDSTVNTGPNAAARGSIVSIYATGGGATKPQLSDGAVTGADLPLLTQPATVTIGGIDAPVSYAGGVPGAVAGLTQINALVPNSIAPGNAVPVVVTIGGTASTPGVTLAVK